MPPFQLSDIPTPDVAIESCDACIVGAGIAGLNGTHP
jgi:cation diffusion facilitator CzcD-associated flavoprotein CzcO